MNYNEKIQRNSNDILLIPSEEEELFRKKFEDTSTDRKCTVCGNLVKDFQPHQALRVIVCNDCFQSYDNAVFLSNKDGTDKNCRWCAKPCSSYYCSCCTVVFCSDCLIRNFSSEYVEKYVKNNPEWKCLICNERQLWALRAQCANAYCDTDDELNVSKSKSTEETGKDETEFSSDFEEIPEASKRMTLTPQIIKEAREIFEPSKRDFNRLIEKIKTNCEKFSALTNKIEFKSADDVLDLAKKVSSMCKSIQEGVAYIDGCNKSAYKEWFNKNIYENPKTSKSQKPINPINTHNISLNSTQTSFVSIESIDLLNISSKSQNVKTELDVLNSSQETNINESHDNDDIINKELRKTKTKEVLQSLRLKKSKPESQTSGVSENFMNFLDKVKVDISKNDEPQNTTMPSNNIKTEVIDTNNSAFSNKTVIREPEENPLKDNSKTESFTQNGNNELQERLLTDFDENGVSVELKTIQYLCDKTGDIFDGFEIISSGNSTPIVVFNDYDQDSCSDLGDLHNSIDTKLNSDSFIDLQEERISNSAEPVNLLKNDFTVENNAPINETEKLHEDETDKETTNENQIIEDTKKEDETFEDTTNEDETDEVETNEDEINESDVELNNDKEQEKQLMFNYLIESDCSSFSSITSISSSSSSSFEEKYVIKEEENQGYIQTLDIANELYKLQSNLPKIESSTYEINIETTNENEIIEDTVKEDETFEATTNEDETFEATTNEDETDEVETNEQSNLPKIESSTYLNINPTLSPEEDPKFSQKCEVRLNRENFDEMNNLHKIPNTFWGYRILHEKSEKSEESSDEEVKKDEDSDDDVKEINRLLNLKTLENKKRALSSDDSSVSSIESTKLRKKKKKVTSKSDCDTDTSSTRDDDDDDASKSDVSTDILSEYELTVDKNEKSKDVLINNLLMSSTNDSDSSFNLSDFSSDSDDENNKKPNKNKTKNANKNEVPEWKKDVLLTGRLDVSLNGGKNKSELNDLSLEQQEKKFFEKSTENKLLETKQKINIDVDDNAIVLSDTESSKESDDDDNDSDIIFVSNKRKNADTNEKENNIPHKKGRKNIKKVLEDSELQEETQKADLEEEKRKERISLKNKSLDAVLSQSSSLSQEDVGLILDVDETNKTHIVKIPQILVNPLKPHQVNGVKFMWDVCFESVSQIKKTEGAGCILAHCMGLGKTMQIVILTYTLLTHQSTGVRHALVVCPLSTVFNWRNEFEQTLKNAPETISIFDVRPDRHRSFRDRIFEVKKWRKIGGVLIIGYDSFTALVNEKNLSERVTNNYQETILEALINPGPDLVVCDEGHILKSCKTHKFKALNRVRTKRRIILTGTPLQNNLMEYWHMVSFVKPHLLGTYKEYSNRFVNPIVNGQYEDSSPTDIQLMKKRSHVLHKKLQTTVHRYELSELKQYLPNKHEYVLFIQLSELQIQLYELYLENITNVTTGQTMGNLFRNFHDLQNIWTHPALLHHRYEKKKTYDEDFDPNLDPDTVNSQNALGENWYKNHMPNDLETNLSYGPKMVLLFSILRESCSLGEKLLVFSSSIPELDLIESFLKRDSQTWIKNFDYYRMDGSVLPEKRMHYCNSFNDETNKRARLFLISHKVGGLGLNLIAANRVVLMDVNWNPAYDTQSVFRVYRFGQKKPCYIYRLVSLGTMEELVYSRAVTKLAISCRVVDEQQIQRHFKEDDQHKLYKLNTDYLNQEPVTPNIPADRLLANLWRTHKPILYNFKDHQSMLENLAHEELNEEEMKVAWEEFRKEEEAERERNAQQAAFRQIMIQQNQYQNIPSTSGLMQPVIPQQVKRFKPVNRLPVIEQTTRPLLSTPYPLDTIQRLPSPYVNNLPTDKKITKPNPFNQNFQNKNKKNTEMIVPDIIVNKTPGHLNNLPSTSTSVSNSSGNTYNGKKIYGNPRAEITNKRNDVSEANTVNSGKKMPKLLPVDQNVYIDFLAKNGVFVSPQNKKNIPTNISDDIINLE